jgi:predicted regulator of Ras-like GTPase activity (Roadblock/LC7/MglB family)
MLGFLKNIMRKLADMPAETVDQPAPEYTDTEVIPAPASTAPVKPALPRQPVIPSNSLRQNGHAGHSNGSQSGKGVEIPLQALLTALPLELHPRVRQSDVGDAIVTIPLEKILSQLARGVVKISFGELRQGAPGVFSSENDRDRVLVTLPLSEILLRLNPTLITRRRAQKRIEVPAEIRSPFDAQGEGLSFFVAPLKTAGPASAPVPAAAPIASNVPAAPVAPVVPAAPITPFAAPVPTSPPAPIIPMKPAAPHFPMTPLAAPRQVTPIPFPSVAPARSNSVSAPTPVPPAAASSPAPSLVSAPRPPVELKMVSPTSAPAASAAVPIGSRSAAETETFALSLTAVAEAWPEAIHKEIVHHQLVDATLNVPVEAIEQGLRQGRLIFSWKSVRSWLKSPAANAPSTEDSAALELPLKIVAPLFLNRQRENAKSQQKVSIDKEIPNLFFGFPQPGSEAAPQAPASAPSPAVAKPDTNYYTWDENSDTAHIHASEVKNGPSPGTKFMSRYATPNEVVARASALDGVAGALIALPDGLMVASRLSPDLNGDTLAAFLPHIFGKVSQCTKELRMGDLNNLNFTVGNVPWKIFRVNAIFFAAFGRVGEGLPTSQLAALAAELDHKPR